MTNFSSKVTRGVAALAVTIFSVDSGHKCFVDAVRVQMIRAVDPKAVRITEYMFKSLDNFEYIQLSMEQLMDLHRDTPKIGGHIEQAVTRSFSVELREIVNCLRRGVQTSLVRHDDFARRFSSLHVMSNILDKLVTAAETCESSDMTLTQYIFSSYEKFSGVLGHMETKKIEKLMNSKVKQAEKKQAVVNFTEMLSAISQNLSHSPISQEVGQLQPETIRRFDDKLHDLSNHADNGRVLYESVKALPREIKQELFSTLKIASSVPYPYRKLSIHTLKWLK